MNRRLVWSSEPAERLAGKWLAWRSDPEARRFNPYLTATIEKLTERIQVGSAPIEYASYPSPRAEILRFAKLECSGEVVGQISLSSINSVMKTAELGYQIDPAHQGCGYATEMVFSFLNEVFKKTDIRKIVAVVAVENSASLAVLKKAGFLREGLLREHYLIEGCPTDEVIFGVLKSEWRPFLQSPSPSELVRP